MDKRDEVLKELGPIAEVLGINIDYVVEDKREYLVCDYINICTNGTSIYGIREEFFGYVFLKEWHNRSLGAFEKQTKNHIRQYWYNKDFHQPYLKIK